MDFRTGSYESYLIRLQEMSKVNQILILIIELPHNSIKIMLISYYSDLRCFSMT